MGSLFVAASQVPPRPVDWLWRDRIPSGALSIVDGDPGTNKSTLVYDLASRLSVGRKLPGTTDVRPPCNSVLISDEDTSAAIRRMLESSGADLDRVVIYDSQDCGGSLIQLPQDVAMIEEEIRQHSANLVVLDPLASFIGNVNSDRTVRAALSPLAKCARRTGAAIVMMRHPRKSGASSALYRGSGSIAIIAAVRSGLLMARKPGDDSSRVIAQYKSSFGRLAGSLSCRLAPRPSGVTLADFEACQYTAEDLLAATSAQDAPAVLEACRVLFAILVEGSQWATDVVRVARKAGVSVRTLRRAKQLLQVQSKRHGFGKDSRFYWVLPKQSDLMQHLRKAELDELADALFDEPPMPPRIDRDDGLPTFMYRGGDNDEDDSADWWKRGTNEENDEDATD